MIEKNRANVTQALRTVSHVNASRDDDRRRYCEITSSLVLSTTEEDLQLVVRTGDDIDGQVLTRLSQFARGNQFDLNENSVLWIGNFGLAKTMVLSRIRGEND